MLVLLLARGTAMTSAAAAAAALLLRHLPSLVDANRSVRQRHRIVSCTLRPSCRTRRAAPIGLVVLSLLRMFMKTLHTTSMTQTRALSVACRIHLVALLLTGKYISKQS